jgi:hypothetical protein
MKLSDEKLIKALFTSSLVVALTIIKSKLEHRFEDLDILFYFMLFLTSLFILSIIELGFEKLDELDWFKRIFSAKDHIYGWWLNYAVDRDTKEIYNFALLKIDSSDGQVNVDGRTFKACLINNGQIDISPDGHFLSTITQFQNERGLLGFNFTVDDSEKVRACKHKIYGNAQYFFDRNDGVPTTFTGEFSTETPVAFCSIIGHRLDEKQIIQNDSLVERYKNALNYAIQRKWIELDQIQRA